MWELRRLITLWTSTACYLGPFFFYQATQLLLKLFPNVRVLHPVASEDVTAVVMKSSIFWDILKVNLRLSETYHLKFESWRISQGSNQQKAGSNKSRAYSLDPENGVDTFLSENFGWTSTGCMALYRRNQNCSALQPVPVVVHWKIFLTVLCEAAVLCSSSWTVPYLVLHAEHSWSNGESLMKFLH
jgi:hypothetical protein